MEPFVTDNLKGEQHSDDITKLRDKCFGLLKTSREAMARNYGKWDMHDSVFRGEVWPDAKEREQDRKGEPIKMVVPHSYAQVMTFASFLFLLFKQNQKLFTLEPTGNEDHGTKNADIELVLEHQIRQNQFNQKMFQVLIDIPRYGLGIMDCSWTKETVNCYVPGQPVVDPATGIEVPSGMGWQQFTKYEGNQINCVSPYKFFYDTRRPLTEFQRGEFCAVDEEFSRDELKVLESQGIVAGIDHIPEVTHSTLTNWNDHRGGTTKLHSNFNFFNSRGTGGSGKGGALIMVTKMQLWLVPSQYKMEDGTKLGEEEFKVLYIVWLANDTRIIRLEPAYSWHNRFSYAVGQFTPDMSETLSFSLCELISQLQSVISWFVNSHISSVRRVMTNRLVVDPHGIETNTLDGEGDIYLRKSASQRGIDRYIKQLQVQDVTSGHLNDVEVLSKLIEVVTGVNGNAMGQYNSGRRSAQESRAVASGAASRMKLHGHVIWEMLFGAVGTMMISNSRQELSAEMFQQIIGQSPDVAARYTAFKGTPMEVITASDYLPFDSTLASEKGFMAQSMQELFSILLSTPGAAQAFDLDPKAILEEVQMLRGSGSIRRFSLAERIASGKTQAPAPQPASVL